MTMSKGLELSLAVTNLPLLLTALYCAFRTGRAETERKRLKGLWMKEFVLDAASAFLGAFVHGFDLPRTAHNIVWSVLFALLFGLADGLMALALELTDAYGAGTRAASLVPASLLLGLSLYLHWNGSYSVNMIPFCVYGLAVVAVSAVRIAGLRLRGASAKKMAALVGLVAAALLSVAVFDGKTFSLAGWKMDGSVVSHLLLVPAQLINLSLALDSLKKESDAPRSAT